MSQQTVVLITGASRGIGRGLVAAYLFRENTTVITAVRDPPKAAANLVSLPKAKGSNFVVVKIDSANFEGPAAAVEELESKHAITHLDIVIANAAICDTLSPIATVPISTFRHHMDINTVAPLALFQAALPLLRRSSHPKFVAVSTVSASNGEVFTLLPAAGYGESKAALNHWIRTVHHEHPELVAFPIHPGWVQTDAGQRAADRVGREKAPTTVEESASGIIHQIDLATRESGSDEFLSFDGKRLVW